MHSDLVQETKSGLFCPAGNFYIDPWKPVENAVITHAHSDHARPGNGSYYCTESSLPIMKHRLGSEWAYRPLAYGETFILGNAKLSLHPAGHILGSAQVRIEAEGKVWVASGDFKRDADPTCAPFEVVPCDALITEATFGLPIYRWKPASETAKEIFDWWQACKTQGRTALLFCYSLGKAQRVLAELAAYTTESVYLHGAVEVLTQIYREAGVPMLPTIPVAEVEKGRSFEECLVIAPPSAFRSTWMKRFKSLETGFASGWMRVRAGRRHKGYDRGFVLSDHADWPQLIQTVQQTGAQTIKVTHGKSDVLVHFLREMGLNADELSTHYGDEQEIA